MVTASFTINLEMLKKLELVQEETNLNFSKTVNHLIALGLAYKELLKAQEEEKKNKTNERPKTPAEKELETYGLGDGVVGRIVAEKLIGSVRG